MAGAAPSLRVRALRLLAAREHSRLELKRKLAGEDLDFAEIDALLDEFEGKGWLSEQRLAQQMIDAARGRYGIRRVLERMREKGLDEDALDAAAQVLQRQDTDSARAVWGKRFGRRAITLQDKAKQARFLAGRGFSSEAIHQVLGDAAEE